MAIDYNNLLSSAGDISQILASIAGQRAAGRQQAGTANQNQDRIALDRARLGLDASNSANNYGLNSANAENQFGLTRSGQDLQRSNAQNSFGLGRVGAGVDIGNLDLAQKKFALSAPGARAGNAVRGDILSNAKDVSFAGLPAGINVPTINGGLRPSMFSDSTRALGANMSQQALSEQQAGDHFAPLPSLPDYVGPSSGLPNYKAPPGYVAPPPLPDLTPLPKANGFDTALGAGSLAGALAGAGKGGGSGSGGNLVQLAKDIWNAFHHGGNDQTPIDSSEIDPNTGFPYEASGPKQTYIPQDDLGLLGKTTLNYDPNVGDHTDLQGLPNNDPMAEYEAWLAQQGGGGEPGGGDQWTGNE